MVNIKVGDVLLDVGTFVFFFLVFSRLIGLFRKKEVVKPLIAVDARGLTMDPAGDLTDAVTNLKAPKPYLSDLLDLPYATTFAGNEEFHDLGEGYLDVLNKSIKRKAHKSKKKSRKPRKKSA